MTRELFQEFKPTIFFLLRFVGVYLLSNLLYGLYITRFYPGVDPITHFVTANTAGILKLFATDIAIADQSTRACTLLIEKGDAVLSVFEGCNSVNIIIIFLSFLLAFGPWNKKLVWFAMFGVLIIYLTNLFRILTLFFIASYSPKYMYFVHKYVLTAILFGVVLILWIVWLRKSQKPAANEAKN